MADISTKNHRCANCGASLDLARIRKDIVRCLFCGSDHKLSSAKADAQREVHAERRMGAVVAPYILAPLIGFFGYHAVRDFWWAAYEGTPAMIIGLLFLVIGLMSFRMPAAVGLAIIGISGALKPFVRPIPSSYHDGFYSPTSETAFYYLVPGLVASLVAFAFFSSLKIREFGPALQSLKLRLPVLGIAMAATLGAHFYVGQTFAELAGEHREAVDSMRELALSACNATAPEKMEAPLTAPLIFTGRDGVPGRSTVLFASCGVVHPVDGESADPLYIDQLGSYLRAYDASAPRFHRSAHADQRQEYEDLLRANYLVVYSKGNANYHVVVVSRASGEAVRRVSVPSVHFTDAKLKLFASLAAATGGEFPKANDKSALATSADTTLAPSPSPSIPPPLTPTRAAPEPLVADFVHHSTRTDSRGALWIFGMVTNGSAETLAKTEVMAIFKDREGKETGTELGYGIAALGPGESAPVFILSTDPPESESISFETNPRPLASGRRAQGLAVLDFTQRELGYGGLSISGKVINKGASSAEGVQVYVLVFDGNDKLVSLPLGYTKPSTIPKGAEARFLVKTPPLEVKSPRIELQVHGRHAP